MHLMWEAVEVATWASVVAWGWVVIWLKCLSGKEEKRGKELQLERVGQRPESSLVNNSVHRVMGCLVGWERGWQGMVAPWTGQTYHLTGRKESWQGLGPVSLKLQKTREKDTYAACYNLPQLL